MKTFNLENNTMNESDLQRLYNFSIHPRNSKVYSDKRFVIIDNGSQGGTHWTCFSIKVINHSILIHSVVSQIKFYSINYQNQKQITIIDYKI